MLASLGLEQFDVLGTHTGSVEAVELAQQLASLRQPVLVLAPHDDLWEQTERVYSTGGLPANARFVELPHLGLDIAYYATEEVFALVTDFLAM